MMGDTREQAIRICELGSVERRAVGVHVQGFHDEPEYPLPIPARYIIDTQGIIRAAEVKADYTIRSEPSGTLRQLRTLL